MLKESFLLLINFIILIIFLLVGVAFLTLLERKVLGYIQIRKGPNKVGFLGILQPFSDAIKLFTKEHVFPIYSNYLIYYFCPVFGFILSMLIWVVYPSKVNLVSFNLGFLFIICCLSLGVYSIMIAGWSSNSNYSLLGGLRSVAQTISYEISMALVLLGLILFLFSFNLLDLFKYQIFFYFLFLCFPLMLMWFSIMLAETNRTPFDFAEGESELVSGFNVEYSGGGFALIFLAEYLSILFMSFMFSLMFLGANLSSFSFFLKFVFISYIFIWVRGTLPRFRYDKLMNLTWKFYLSLVINLFLFYMGLKLMIYVI
uniref:NADH-ubiquinone oxidoreductase chain 1 n=1 Tax=Mongoloraphidia harmandi TaxID=633873 RepID=C8YXC9_9NEOP|nr:NADH dehydrogenase subunit 1 [Mongoloraphidia harmandi]ACO92563.1 NADH dehydrogenase subunit 1 [Mongoloraphidia harmandi]